MKGGARLGIPPVGKKKPSRVASPGTVSSTAPRAASSTAPSTPSKTSNLPATSSIAVRQCGTVAEFDECVELEHLTWGEQIVVPSAMFVVAHETGGQILGAYEKTSPDAPEKLVGFLMAVAGIRGQQIFLHSHMTAVRPEYQNRGIGRQLKLAQREDALARGIALVEWTFDPLEIRNAYFNIVRLGAVIPRFIPNCYGVTDSPLHGGLPTDRLVAEWWVGSARVKAIVAGTARKPVSGRAVKRVGLPANIGEIKQRDRAAAKGIQTEIREKFQRLFAEGYTVTGLETGAREVSYVLERYHVAQKGNGIVRTGA
jgi:predicted GNAT superfamily acetyltransferase